ncbi:helix-turn-helix domain-containing protein [Streptomyces sp. NPDC021100]|uniref:helix-turn-helix domain-containing protein n=1 Tax=Streptomyces sp. NPDC021100 TaxID=3365114 RepID=UPI0037B20409
MPPRTTPTERQKRLGSELRKMRTAAGVSTDYAARLLGVDRTKISHMESGTRVVSPERLRILACNYACSDERYIEALADMATDRKQGWWERYRADLPPGMLDIAELEWHAERVLTSQVMHLPGLLQTEDYARSIFAAVLPPPTRLEVELRVAFRMERARVLRGDRPLDYVGYIHETALRTRFGGRDVTRRQLEYLAEVSELDHVVLRVVPVSSGAFPGAGHSLLYAEGPVRQLDTAQLDSELGPLFWHAELQLTKCRGQLAWMENAALDREESRALIRALAREL